MKNYKIIPIVVAIVGVVGFGIWSVVSNNTGTTTNTNIIDAPDDSPDINGTILSVVGNEITIKKYVITTTLSPEDQAAKKAERQNMTYEERQALKATENAETPTENIKITIPVGTVVVKTSGSGDSDGSGLVETTLDEAKSGFGIQIWKDGDEVEFVKIKVI